MNIQVLKFPKVKYKDRPVWWDTRQWCESELEQKPFFVIPSSKDPNCSKIMSELSSLNRKQSVELLGSEHDEPGRFLSEIASMHFGFPSSRLRVIGVTGTNGKTSTCSMLRHLLLKTGQSVCEMGTLGLKVWLPSSIEKPHLHLETGFTTPSGPTLHSLFWELEKANVTNVVMEVSSHACVLGRVGGTWFDGLVFTNLTPDHLDFHGDMGNYEKAKKMFFLDYALNPVKCLTHKQGHTPRLGAVVVDSKVSHEVSLRLFEEIKGYSKARVALSDLEIRNRSLEGTQLFRRATGVEFRLPVLGDFQIENYLGAQKVLEPLGVKDLEIQDFAGIPGRMEAVKSRAGKLFFVDYAHTPDALKKSLETMRSLRKESSKIFLVFGCGGDRDSAKRPLMGQVAAMMADSVILTNDNPRTESPEKIIEQIKSGVNFEGKVVVELDRKKAIQLAHQKMSLGDVCLVAGKGHEQYQIVGKQNLDFSDQDTVKQL